MGMGAGASGQRCALVIVPWMIIAIGHADLFRITTAPIGDVEADFIQEVGCIVLVGAAGINGKGNFFRRQVLSGDGYFIRAVTFARFVVIARRDEGFTASHLLPLRGWP